MSAMFCAIAQCDNSALAVLNSFGVSLDLDQSGRDDRTAYVGDGGPATQSGDQDDRRPDAGQDIFPDGFCQNLGLIIH